MAYLTRQSVREEAGFQNYENPEVLSGVVDGTNRNFAVSRTPIVDTTDDDNVGIADVIVRVNGVPVDISEVNATTGLITLVEAPSGDDTEVTGQYASSALPDAYIDKIIVEAEAIVNGSLKKYIATPLSEDLTDWVARARRISVLYAAGFVLVRDYGKNTDTEETSKDGYEKLKTAKSLLTDLISDIRDNGDTSNSGGSAATVSEGHIFGRRECNPRSHNYFMRKEC